MKINKKFCMLGIVFLLSTFPISNILLNNNFNNSKLSNTDIIEKNSSNKIDYNEVEKMLNSDFNLENESNFLKESKISLTNEEKINAINKQKELFNEFKNNDLNIEQITDILLEKYHEIKSQIKNIKINLDTQEEIILNNTLTKSIDREEAKQKLDQTNETIRHLKIAKVTSSSICAAAAITAVSLYTASFFNFGATAGLASVFSTISWATGVLSSAIDVALICLDEKRVELENVFFGVCDTITLGKVPYNLVKIFTGLKPIFKNLSWAVLGLNGVTSSVDTALTIIDLLNE